MNSSLKHILHWVGSTLALTGIVFVVLRLNDYSTQVDFSHFNAFTWLFVAIFTFIYGLANIFLALAWWKLLMYFGAYTSHLWAIRTYGVTQLAKYVPGNIIHLASRQVLGLAAGISGWPLAKASIWELGLISITGALFFILILPQLLPLLTVTIAAIIFSSLLIVIFFLLKQYVGLVIAQAFGLYTAFLIVSGTIFVGLLILLLDDFYISPLQTLIFGGSFIVAWLIGLVTPGAPAGVGVREFILVMLLQTLVPVPDLLLAILLSRIVTVGGDMLFFLLTSLSQYKNPVIRINQ